MDAGAFAEYGLPVALASVACGLLAGRLRDRSLKRRGTMGCAALTILGLGVWSAWALHDPPQSESMVRDRPIEVPPDGYAGSESCRPCHPGEYATSRASYHATMTQVAGPDTVLGDFDGRVLRHGSASFRLSRDGDQFWVEMPDIDAAEPARAPRVRRRILMTTGSHNIQTYWYGTGNTRLLGLLPFVHVIDTAEWLPRDASFLMPPRAEPISEAGRWNKTCIECHATQGRLRPVTVDGVGGHDTHVAEFGIGCESCHGPAEDHIAAYENPVVRYLARFDDLPAEGIVLPTRLEARRTTEVCGQCHSTSVWTSQEAIDEFMEHGFAYRPGDRLADTKSIVRGRAADNPPEVHDVLAMQPGFVPNTFWADGMNRIAGREYNDLLESPCFERGELTCLSCHQMHQQADDPRPLAEWRDDQLKPGMRGNTACTQCHEELSDPARLTAHTHHTAGSSGSNCYNCHMPHTTYGLLKAVRSHQIRSPRVQVSVETGRPNACNLCHLDQPLRWTAHFLTEWYDQERPQPLPEQDHHVASLPLMALRGDAGQRALAAWNLSRPDAVAVADDRWQALYLAILLDDPYPAVRQIAHRSLTRMPGFANFDFDPVAATAQRQAAANRALQHWAALPLHLLPLPSDALLIGPRGARMEIVLELLRQRDDRPVVFAE